MTSPRRTGLRRMPWLLLLCLVLPACESGNKKVTKANLDRIKPGMTLAEVEALLGPGDAEGGVGLTEGSSVADAAGIGGDLQSVQSRPASGVKWVVWKGPKKRSIRIGFVGDRVQPGKIEPAGF